MLRMLWTLASVSIGCAPATVHSLRSQSVGLTARTRGLLCSICPALLRSRSCGRLQRGSHRMASTATPPEAIVKDVTLRPGKSSKHNPLHESIFVSDDAPVYEVPMQVIHRPLQSFTNENKVNTFVEDMQKGDTFTPIEVLWVQKGDQDFYFAFGGCHRWEAHRRLNKPTIKARLVKTTPKSLSIYLGRDPFQ